MILVVGDRTHVGRAVDVDRELDPRRVAAAVRTGHEPGQPAVRVRARSPPPVYERVCPVLPDAGLRVRTALAAAGRARGFRTPADQEIQQLESRLASATVPDRDATAERKAVAGRTTETDRLRERVAECRGRLQTRRANDLPTDAVEADLNEAVSQLSAVETEAVAASQDLARSRRGAPDDRDRLETRLELEDTLANARREARRFLVDRLRDSYAAAVRDAPGSAADGPFAADPVTATLAVARVARLDTPVVCDTGRFPDADRAAAWLGAPVIRL